MKRGRGFYFLPRRATLRLDSNDAELLPAVKRLQAAAGRIGVELKRHDQRPASVNAFSSAALVHPEAYTLAIDESGVHIGFRAAAGFRAAVATLRQILRGHGRRLPRLEIRDRPDFPRRGVLLDVSRGRVPRLETLLELVDRLADFKINEFQLYTEHTFAYRRYRAVWQSWGALTGAEIQKLDARCRDLGIDLVPNQNSFGHLRYFLADPRLKKLAEVAAPYADPGGGFVRRPSTLAPNHPGTLPFLRELYDELLPNFSSRLFNVGCDETWDLGRGQSKKRCERRGKGRVYLEFVKKVHREVDARGRRMMFWGDIILNHPELIRELPRDVIAVNWGYEAGHPFPREAARFAKAKVPFYVCPGTSTWMTLIGRHDNALANLRAAATAGRRHGAVGYLIADWGDGGHPQPLAVSYLPWLAGAALSWCAATFAERQLAPALSRDVFGDRTGRIADAAHALGLVHRRLKFFAPNLTPLGAVIAAPQPETRELFCRDGLKYYAQIAPRRIRAALREIERQRDRLRIARRTRLLAQELDVAARMAGASCRFMLWQQAVAAGKASAARRLARAGIRELEQLEKDFAALWPRRNKGTPQKASAFLRWRRENYRESFHTVPLPARHPRN